MQLKVTLVAKKNNQTNKNEEFWIFLDLKMLCIYLKKNQAN